MTNTSAEPAPAITIESFRGRPARLRKERLIRAALFGAALFSLVISVLIIYSLLQEAWVFMRDVDWGVTWGQLGWFPRRGIYDMPTLLVASLYVTAVAMIVAAPIGLGAAIYLAEYARPGVRRVLKPMLEVLAGIPSVVLGFFALTWIAPNIVANIGGQNRGSILAAGIGVGILTIPLVASISEDAMAAVPKALREASAGMGARKVTTVLRVVLPASISGLVAAFIVAISRAIGETMVVFLAGGAADTSLFPSSVTEPGLTMTAAMASLSTGTDSVVGEGLTFQSLFFVGLVLFAITLVLNMIGNFFVNRIRGAVLTMSPTTSLADPQVSSDVRRAIAGSRSDPKGFVFRALIMTALGVALVILAVLIISVLGDGWPTLSTRLGDFLSGSLRSRSEDVLLGVHQGLYGSLWIALFTAVFAFPLGVAAAIYLEEYAPRSRVTTVIELAIRNLAGVPSVVYGLLGLFLFVETDWLADITGGRTVISAGLTLAVLVLPIVIITSQEAIRSVPSGLKEGAYGVGATQWEMIRTQVLPYAAPGILTGTLLSMSRAIGEAAPLILIGAISGGLTANPGLLDVGSLNERFTALPINIVTWTQQGGRDEGFREAAAAGIVVLLVVVLVLNLAAIVLRNRFEKKRG